jgi:hypothetical protein
VNETHSGPPGWENAVLGHSNQYGSPNGKEPRDRFESGLESFGWYDAANAIPVLQACQ